MSATLAPKFPDVAELLGDAADDICALASFPRQHWTKLWSTNSIERLKAEKRYMSEASMALLRASNQEASLEAALANT
jgi:transposase-like protein